MVSKTEKRKGRENMKRIVVYYSLSGNTGEAAKQIAKGLGADLLKLETKRKMPKSFAAQLFL